MPGIKNKNMGSSQELLHSQAQVAKNVICTGVTAENLSRHEMLQWVNETLASSLQKIEEMSTGECFCDIT